MKEPQITKEDQLRESFGSDHAYYEAALFRLNNDLQMVESDDAIENSFVFCRGVNLRLPKDKTQLIYDIIAGYIQEQIEALDK